MSKPITDIISAIDSCRPTLQSAGATAMEIAEQTRKDISVVRREIKRAIDAGTVECVKERRVCIDNVVRSFPVYRTVKKSGKVRAS